MLLNTAPKSHNAGCMYYFGLQTEGRRYQLTNIIIGSGVTGELIVQRYYANRLGLIIANLIYQNQKRTLSR